MKRPPDPHPPPFSSHPVPISFRFPVYSSRSGAIAPALLQLWTMGPFVCYQLAILVRILRLIADLEIESVPIHDGVPRSDRVWSQLPQIWKSLASTVQGHLLHAPLPADLLHSVWPQLCMVVGVTLQCSNRYPRSLLFIF